MFCRQFNGRSERLEPKKINLFLFSSGKIGVVEIILYLAETGENG